MTRLIARSDRFRVTRRGFLRASSAAAGAGALGGFRTRAWAAEVEDQLNMMGWADYISPDNIKAWEEKYDSKLVYDSYASNDEMYSKLQLAQGSSGYDLGMNTDFMIPLLIKGGILQKFDKSQVPNLSNVRPEIAGPDFDPSNAYTIPKSWGSEGLHLRQIGDQARPDDLGRLPGLHPERGERPGVAARRSPRHRPPVLV